MKKILFTILFLCFALSVDAQNINALKAKCRTSNNYASLTLQLDGNTYSKACPNKSNFFENPIVNRFNFTDSYTYGNGLDIQGIYNGTGEIPLVYFDYAINAPFSGASVYQGLYNGITYNAATVSALSSLVGLRNTVSHTGAANMHDIQGLTSAASITNGRAGSSISGAAVNVGVFSPATAQDVSGIVLTSAVNNTTVRSFQSIWIQDPTTTGSTILDGENNALRVGSGTSKLFTIAANGQSIKMTFSTPASSAETCTIGTIKVDANFVYVCTATNTYKRATLNAF